MTEPNLMTPAAYDRWVKQTTCPRCGDPIPNAAYRGQYAGAISRTDDMTEVCSGCGVDEALSRIVEKGSLISQDHWPVGGAAVIRRISEIAAKHGVGPVEPAFRDTVESEDR